MTWEPADERQATAWEEANLEARTMTRKALGEMAAAMTAFKGWVGVGYRLTPDDRRLIGVLSGALDQLQRRFR
jgi:hypothetical protein